MILQRSLAVLAAALLVCAVALATLGPRAVSLGRAIGSVDNHLEDVLRGWCVSFLGPWAWNDLAMPLLVRPAWLFPATLGIICAGLSLSLSYRNTARQSHRRS